MTLDQLGLPTDWRDLLGDVSVAGPLLGLAYDIASLSPDPNTQVGAVLITREDKLFTAHNKPPEWMTPEQIADREFKNRHIIHAERGVLYKAIRAGADVYGAVMLAPWAPCIACAQTIAQLKLDTLVIWAEATRQTPDKWRVQVEEGQSCVARSTVRLINYDGCVQTDATVLINGEPYRPAFYKGPAGQFYNVPTTGPEIFPDE